MCEREGWVNLGVRVCVPIPARDLQGLFNRVREAEESGANLIEIRLDYMSEKLLESVNRLKEVVSVCSVPLIATNRHKGQGGECMLSEGERIESLIMAAEAGFDYIDIELDTRNLHEVVDKIKAHGAKVIISYHIFTHTPQTEELEALVRRQVEANADICKVVSMANSLLDSVRCLVFTYEMSKRTSLVCFAMGEKGLLSRILSPVFGASFTYASLGAGLETAPGQISIHEMREIYRRMRLE
ncbi:MAG: type I 3-dehydroquinate dehydratase [Candidatus Bathyarchaeia archaeon]